MARLNPEMTHGSCFTLPVRGCNAICLRRHVGAHCFHRAAHRTHVALHRRNARARLAHVTANHPSACSHPSSNRWCFLKGASHHLPNRLSSFACQATSPSKRLSLPSRPLTRDVQRLPDPLTCLASRQLHRALPQLHPARIQLRLALCQIPRALRECCRAVRQRHVASPQLHRVTPTFHFTAPQSHVAAPSSNRAQAKSHVAPFSSHVALHQ